MKVAMLLFVGVLSARLNENNTPLVLVEKVTFSDDADISSIPARALCYNGDKAYVWILRTDDTVCMREVRVAKHEDGVAKIDQGLASGDYIVTLGVQKLFENQSVRSTIASGSH